MVRTQIQLTEEQVRELRKVAVARRRSVAEVIRQAVDVMLKAGTTITHDQQKEEALAVVGRFSSGRHDVSKDHDTHLSESFRK